MNNLCLAEIGRNLASYIILCGVISVIMPTKVKVDKISKKDNSFGFAKKRYRLTKNTTPPTKKDIKAAKLSDIPRVNNTSK